MAEIQVVVCANVSAGQVLEVAVQLPAGACLADALVTSGLTIVPEAECGVWGQPSPRTRKLQTGDRVEVYRPLLADPKQARRERFARQGARTTGLFAQRGTTKKPALNT